MWVPYQLKEAHTPIGNWVGLVSIYPSTRLDFDWVGFNSSIRWKKRGREGKGEQLFLLFCTGGLGFPLMDEA